MPLVNMKDMLKHAHRHAYAVGAFDLVSLDFLQGIMDAAERCQAPVILSLAESHFEYFNFQLLMPPVEQTAKRASVPVYRWPSTWITAQAGTPRYRPSTWAATASWWTTPARRWWRTSAEPVQ